MKKYRLKDCEPIKKEWVITTGLIKNRSDLLHKTIMI